MRTRVRRAMAGEPLDAVAGLQHLSFTSPWSADAIGWELRETDVARLYVLEEEDASAGASGVRLLAYCACWVIFDELHINSLAVAPDARRRGHARRLLDHVFQDVVMEGVTAATLEVRRSNTAALALYDGLGFQVEGVRTNYYQAPREDALVLWHRALASPRGS
ncbi:MAG TPA: ribosomal protein S18-alanine N-acetyltransferase [Vicinamibacterales bacterium]|nr:ribosomal protein S18-alanine N-acetyltransferase [Vicinamibacterales bacterium]